MQVLKLKQPDPETIITRNRFVLNHIFPIYIRDTKDPNSFILTFYCRQDYDDSYIFLEIMLTESIPEINIKNLSENFLNENFGKFTDKYKTLIEEAKESEQKYVTDLHFIENKEFKTYFSCFGVRAIDSRHNRYLDLFIPRDNFIRIRKFLKTIDIYGIRESDIQEIFFSSKYHNIKFYNITKIVFDASEYYDQDSKYLEEHHKFGVMKRIISHYTMYSEVEKFRMNVASFYPINQNDKLLKPLHYSIYEPTYSKDYMIIDSFLGNEYLYIIYDINWNKKEKKSCLYALKLTPEQYMTTVFVNTNSIFERSTITNGSIND